MKKQLIYSSAFILAATGIVACSENSWNDRLDGFESETDYSEKINFDYTLSNSDYEKIGKAIANVAVTDEEKAAAQAIVSNHYFDQSSPYPAQIAIPYLLDDTKSNYFIYSNGSTAEISFRQCSTVPKEIAAVSSASTLTLTTADYQNVWGSQSDFIPSFTPSHQASNYLPNILKAQYPEAEEGDYAIVSYAVSNEEPYFGDTGEVEVTDNIRNLGVGDNLSAVAVVTAQCQRGLILTDKGGSILYYNTGIDLNAFPVGSIVKVSGSVSAYNHGLQLTNAASIQVVGEEEYIYPTPVVYTPEMVDEACGVTGDFQAAYVAIQGDMSISGNYLNVVIEGASAQGSVYYATDDIKSKLVNGESYTFYGYFVAVNGSSTKYFNILLTDVGPAGGEVSGNVSLTDNIKGLAVGDNLTATAVVSAQCTRGLILTDNGGSILYYDQNIDLTKYPMGTIVNVSGEVSAYNKGLQLSSSATLDVVASASYGYPYPTIYTAEMVDEACAGTSDMLATYVAIQGQMSISGNYYNVVIPGAAAQGSLYYASDELKAQLEDGASYILYGYFIAINGSTTKYFNIVVTGVVPVNNEAEAAALKANTRAALLTPSAINVNEAYIFTGSAWVKAEDVAVLNPSDYEEMGFSDNDLSSADIYIPLYLKKSYPYALADDEIYVAYNLKENSSSCDLFVYDGTDWSINNNGLENVKASFAKTDGKWLFGKYLGKTIYSLFNEAQIELNRTYLLVSGDYCANPVPASNGYGYLLTTGISISGNQIEMANENNGFRFMSEFEVNGNMVSVPEGYFVIRDSNNRFLYLQGTYSSFNVKADAPDLKEDGSIVEGFLFSAELNDNGSWTIVNDRGEGNVRTIYFSSGYTNFAAYTSQSDKDSLPFLYILNEN
ncbi:MAG: hypothetical protein J1E95_08505 [Muribaculaceae bacterium]|nr:hypothetical protein [Muribaculaceae bacterium]